MDDIVIYDKPVDRVRAFIRDYARELYGIENASALGPLVEVAFDPAGTAPNRIRAASELAKYSEVATRSLEYESGKNGPDFNLTILGTCDIQEPALDKRVINPEQLASSDTSATVVELSDGRGKEGS